MLDKVDQIILSKLSSEAPALEAAAKYLLGLGGKRLRPKLCCQVNKLLSKEYHPDIFKISAGIELIHMATLLHDDIIDKSNLRRHQVSPRIKFGEDCTLLCGDFLLVRAFGICSDFDQPIIRATEVACVELTEGEILETPLNKNQHDLNSYINIAIKKTASLFRLACFCGAHLAEAGEEQEQIWSAFGEKVGLAYQMLDDIADACLDQKTLGKPSGLDLIEKKPSLVNILWLQTESSLAKEILLTEKQDFVEDSVLTEQALAELRSSACPVLKEAYNLAVQTETEAFELLSSITAAPKQLENGLTDLREIFFSVKKLLSSQIK